MKNNTINFLKKINQPQNTAENRAHQQYVLNIILTSIIVLTIIGLIIIAFKLLFLKIENYQNNSLPFFVVLTILLIFIGLRAASYKGHDKFASYFLISILFSLASYMGLKWGVDLPAEILFYVLVIIISGILINARMSFISTIIITTALTLINWVHKNQIIAVDRSWIYEPWGNSDIVITSIILLIITTVLWLFNRELKKSETELKNERDNLEIKIEEKTKELRITQANEIAQIYRFAEFGKLSSGLFHDLVNPLTALMLNINKVKIDSENDPNLKLIKFEVSQAVKASEKMKDFIVSVRKQINFQSQKEKFSLNREIEEAIIILNYKARKNNTEIIFNANENIIISGDPVKFNQIVTNLLSNAIDACSVNGQIVTELIRSESYIKLIISDNGCGIKSDLLDKIFEPFFTTKHNGDSLGLGLSLIKSIIEESFLGTIAVESKINHGTTFIITIPTL